MRPHGIDVLAGLMAGICESEQQAVRVTESATRVPGFDSCHQVEVKDQVEPQSPILAQLMDLRGSQGRVLVVPTDHLACTKRWTGERYEDVTKLYRLDEDLSGSFREGQLPQDDGRLKTGQVYACGPGWEAYIHGQHLAGFSHVIAHEFQHARNSSRGIDDGHPNPLTDPEFEAVESTTLEIVADPEGGVCQSR